MFIYCICNLITPYVWFNNSVYNVSPLCLCAVHPHPGGPAGLLPEGPRLRGQPAHRGAPRQAGVLHGGDEDPAAAPRPAVRLQEPQAHVATVRSPRRAHTNGTLFMCAQYHRGSLCSMCVCVCVFVCVCRTETVVEKMLTNWMSICLYSFLKVSYLISGYSHDIVYIRI